MTLPILMVGVQSFLYSFLAAISIELFSPMIGIFPISVMVNFGMIYGAISGSFFGFTLLSDLLLTEENLFEKISSDIAGKINRSELPFHEKDIKKIFEEDFKSQLESDNVMGKHWWILFLLPKFDNRLYDTLAEKLNDLASFPATDLHSRSLLPHNELQLRVAKKLENATRRELWRQQGVLFYYSLLLFVVIILAALAILNYISVPN